MRKFIHLIPLVIALLMAVTLTPVFSQNSEGGRWSAPQMLGTGWWQTMAIDREGRLHIGWYYAFRTSPDDLLDSDVFQYAARSIDGEWTQPNNVAYTGEGGYTVRNALSVTSDGMLHAVYRSHLNHVFSSAFAPIASDANNWSKPVEINGFGYYVDMIADENDILHIVFSAPSGDNANTLGQGNLEGSICPGCGDLTYRRSTDGGLTWSASRPLYLTPDSGSDKPGFFLGANGRIYIGWDEGTDWYSGRGQPQDVRIAYSDDAGLTWSDPIILDGGTGFDRHPVQLGAAELRDGSLMAVWRYATNSDRNIYYQISTDDGETWTAPEPVPGIVARSIDDGPLDDYELIVDVTGAAHLFAVGQTDILSRSNPSLYQVTYRQGFWQPPRRLFYSPEMCPEWPQAVLGPQNDIHLAWFIRGIPEQFQCRVADNTKVLRVYYSHMEGNFQQVATQAFEPTRTPIPTATAFQVLNPTVTPLPTVQVADSTGFVSTEDLYASTTLAGGVLAAAVFCAVAAIIIRLRR
jgi:hypothetical protein